MLTLKVGHKFQSNLACTYWSLFNQPICSEVTAKKLTFRDCRCKIFTGRTLFLWPNQQCQTLKDI